MVSKQIRGSDLSTSCKKTGCSGTVVWDEESETGNLIANRNRDTVYLECNADTPHLMRYVVKDGKLS